MSESKSQSGDPAAHKPEDDAGKPAGQEPAGQEIDQKTDQPQQPDQPAGGGKQSGRVAFDSRGNAVWEWQMKTGIYGRDVDTGRMKKLEAPELQIAEDPLATARRHTRVAEARRQSGFDPYNSSNPPPARPGHSSDEEKPAPPADKPGLLRRLLRRKN